MTTVTSKRTARSGKKAVKTPAPKQARSKTVPSKTGKPLRIREELLPESARYITIDDIEYVAVPVADFGEWYEDALDGAVIDDRAGDAEASIPFDQAIVEIRSSRRGKR